MLWMLISWIFGFVSLGIRRPIVDHWQRHRWPPESINPRRYKDNLRELERSSDFKAVKRNNYLSGLRLLRSASASFRSHSPLVRFSYGLRWTARFRWGRGGGRNREEESAAVSEGIDLNRLVLIDASIDRNRWRTERLRQSPAPSPSRPPRRWRSTVGGPEKG